MCAVARAASVALLLATIAIPATGCGSADPESNGKKFTQETISEIFSLPQAEVKGATVSGIVGQVSQVQRDSDGVAIVFYSDPENVEGQLIADIGNEQVKEDEYVRLSGTVVDYFKGENAFGADLELPRIRSTSFEIVDARALDPAMETIEIGQTKDLAGVKISLVRAEISEKQVRIWVRYKNNSSENFTGTPSLTSRGEQVDEAYTDDYDAPSSSVSPGAKSSGVLVFEAVKPGSRLALTFTGYDTDYNEVTAKFKFGA